jgi:hypothetical protein
MAEVMHPPEYWKGNRLMLNLPNRSNDEGIEFLGVWEEKWYARARHARQVERYRVWLHGQGYTRDEAADKAVRLLMAPAPESPHGLDIPSVPLVH